MFSLESFLIPVWMLYTAAAGFGVIIGSFLNVYIYRFHTGKSLAGHSHCLSCANRLRWFELFPLFSFLALRGRCRNCGCKIPSRYFLVELLTSILFVLALTLSLDVISIGLFWLIFSILVVITVYDLYHFIIPDELTITLTTAVFAVIGYGYYLNPSTVDTLALELVAPLGGVLFLYVLWFVSKGTWLGFGDVKLAYPLGLLVGPVKVFSFIVLSFWVGAAISLGIIAWAKLRGGKESLHLSGSTITMKSAVPFAPFLILSALIILFTRFDVLQLFSFI